MIIAVAGHSVWPTLKLFLLGGHQHEHPPLSDILLHLWLVATNFSFFALRVFANIFFIASSLFTAWSAERIGGRRAYWATLILGFSWPFAFQYGRITGWYCLCLFLVSLLTWTYLLLLENRRNWPWFAFGIVAVLLVWSNYFGIAVLLLLLADLSLFHRHLAIKRAKSLAIVAITITMSFLPLLKATLQNVATHATSSPGGPQWRHAIASVGYPVFSIFGSVAVAPWFLPLSIPILASVLVLFVSIWTSPGRRWLIYFFLSIILLALSGHMDVKRVLFMLPWLFLAMGVAAFSGDSRYPKLALGAVFVIMATGWLGILWGNHYATANLHEPWARVANLTAGDARRGATIISENTSFFFYLDYELGLQREIASSPPWTFLGKDLYQAHGYNVFQPSDFRSLNAIPRGKVVFVNGVGSQEEMQFANVLNAQLRQHCRFLGEFQAAPDPAMLWKQRFAKDVPALAYRTDVVWYDCFKSPQQEGVENNILSSAM